MKAARCANKTTAIATSTTRENAQGVIGDLGLGLVALVDYIVYGEGVSAGKPDPEILESARTTALQCRIFSV
jgi:beta-phosphoglucomutase-like phosphatase (HAD superfamily)